MGVTRWNGTAAVAQNIQRRSNGVMTTLDLTRRDTSVIVPPPGGGGASSRPKIGVYRGYQALDQRTLDYEVFLGRKVDYALEFQGTENTGNLAWPGYMSNFYTVGRMNGRALLLGASLSSAISANAYPANRAVTWTELAAGVYDSTWTAMFNNLVATGHGGAALRGAHEFNIQNFTHRVDAGEEDAFRAAQERWFNIGRARGWSGLHYFNPVNGDYRGVDSVRAYPTHNPVVDLDQYDEYYGERGIRPGIDPPRTAAEQKTKVDQMFTGRGEGRSLDFWRTFAVSKQTGMALSEWGTGSYFFGGTNNAFNYGGGDNPYYVDRFADFILNPSFPPGAPGGVLSHAFWEDGIQGVLPVTPSVPDQGRPIPVPLMRARFLARFGGA